MIDAGVSVLFDKQTLIAHLQRSGSIDPQNPAIAMGLYAAAAVLKNEWTMAVNGGLMLPGMTRPLHDARYAQAIYSDDKIRQEGSKLSISVWTDYEGADRIERGAPAWDIKVGLLNGPHAKTTREGKRYTTVPFRHGSALSGLPGGSGPGERGGRPNFATTLPNSIYRRVLQGRSLTEDQQMSGLQTKLQSIINGMMSGAMGSNYTWKSGAYSGLVRIQQDNGKGRYMTFRRVSDESDPNSWIYPATSPNPVFEAALQAATPRIEEILTTAMQSALQTKKSVIPPRVSSIID